MTEREWQYLKAKAVAVGMTVAWAKSDHPADNLVPDFTDVPWTREAVRESLRERFAVEQ